MGWVLVTHQFGEFSTHLDEFDLNTGRPVYHIHFSVKFGYIMMYSVFFLSRNQSLISFPQITKEILSDSSLKA